MKFSKPELEKVLFNSLDVVLLQSQPTTDVSDPEYTESDFEITD